MKWFIKGLKKYFVFSGRARRKEFWMWTLFTFIFSTAAMILDNILGSSIDIAIGPEQKILSYGYIQSSYLLLTLIPNISIGVRRLHDTGKSGWLLLLIFIPIGGAIWLLVTMCKAGTMGENKYGPDPKGFVQVESTNYPI